MLQVGQPLPQLSTDLIAELEKLHPDKCVERGETLEDANRRAGKRDLINFLIAVRDRQDDPRNILR